MGGGGVYRTFRFHFELLDVRDKRAYVMMRASIVVVTFVVVHEVQGWRSGKYLALSFNLSHTFSQSRSHIDDLSKTPTLPFSKTVKSINAKSCGKLAIRHIPRPFFSVFLKFSSFGILPYICHFH